MTKFIIIILYLCFTSKQVYWRRYESRTRQSPNCILKNQKNNIWRKRIFSMADGILTPCTIMTLISPGDCTLQCGMWLWDHDIQFARWQYPAVWQVALGWHAIEFAQTSAILEFYIWFWFRPHHPSRHIILHQSPKFYPNRTTLGRKKWHHVDFQEGRSQPSWILGIQ